MISSKHFYLEWRLKSLKDRCYMALGGFFLLATLVGMATPIIPQVPFAIMSAFFFSKGSPKIHESIRKNPIIGTAVCNWEDHRVVGPKLKIISSISLILGALCSYFFLKPSIAYAMDLIFLLSIVFVLTRKSKDLRV